MGLFFRSTRPANNQTAVPPSSCPNSQPGCKATLRSRNAFINFVREYRQKCPTSSTSIPFWRMIIKAAEHWNRLSLREKFPYIETAHRAEYIYHARDRRINRIMRLMRKALSSECEVNVTYLEMARKQMQLWKRKMLKDIL